MNMLDGSHTPLIAGLLERISTHNETLDAQRRRQLLGEIARGGMTRKRLATDMKLRAGTVTQHVAELIESGLVHEQQQIRTHEKGRPEVLLACNQEAILAIVVRALSDRLYGSLIDLGGGVRREIHYQVDAATIDAAGMEAIIAQIVDELRPDVGSSRLSGLVVSLPGIVEETAGNWLFSSRFPKAAPMSSTGLSARLGLEVKLQRALNAELGARLLAESDAGVDSTLLLHWGYGIGLAFANKGGLLQSSQGAFGEVGHWRSVLAGDAACRCGEKGCLEAAAALWALQEPMQLASLAEDQFGDLMRADEALARHPLIERATAAVAVALRDAYLLLFPNRITVTGPFVQSPIVREQLIRLFRDSLPGYMPGKVRLDMAVLDFVDEMIGAAKPLLHSTFQQCLEGIASREPG